MTFPTLIWILSIVLLLLLLLSFFFAGAETSMMALNRYRLRHLANQGNKAAKRAVKLLEHPDRLLSMIVTTNTCANIVASALMTFIAAHFWGDMGIAIATVLLTLFILFFCEAFPKSMAALKPERFALPATFLLQCFVVLFSPLIWLIHQCVYALLRLFGLSTVQSSDYLSAEELHTLIKDTGGKIPESYQTMLLQVLELEKLTVADIMIPRQNLVGIDLTQNKEDIIEQILNSPYRRLPVYTGETKDIIGFVRIREIFPSLHDTENWDKDNLLKHLVPPYVVPETTPLHKQLLNFKRLKKRSALVVDEYGEILGMITLEDLLEEIVGEFTTDFTEIHPEIIPQKDGSYLVSGQVSLRELNRFFKWQLPLKGQKTLSGYLIAYLQMIPETSLCVLLQNHPIEILQVAENRIKMVRIKKPR